MAGALPAKARRQRVVHGDDLLYEFFQHALSDDTGAFAEVPRLLLETMGIWMPLDVYKRWPVLLPFVVRDPTCRPHLGTGRPDAWGTPNSQGYLRDDNSLIKGLPRALRVRGPKGRKVSGARMGTEFVAAHVWRVVTGTDQLASRIPELNSFVPNLVWLPGQIAKLTDREESVVQRTAQAMAYAIYRDAPVEPHLAEIVQECWERLPEPDLPAVRVSADSLNFFEATPRFFATRQARLDAVIEALEAVEAGRPLSSKVVTTRYGEGIPQLNTEAVCRLRSRLLRYRESQG